jgi:hypothetical protein
MALAAVLIADPRPAVHAGGEQIGDGNLVAALERLGELGTQRRELSAIVVTG